MSKQRLKKLEKLFNNTEFKPLITMTDDEGKLVHWKTQEPVTADDMKRADIHVSVLWG